MAADMRIIQRYIRRLDREPAAERHRIARVDDEVHDDLFDLPGIGMHPMQTVGQRGGKFNVLADDAPKHLLETANDLLEVGHPRFDHLSVAEGQ